MQITDSRWQALLDETAMNNFDAIWRQDLQPVDVPNKGRGGWSEVGYLPLPEHSHGLQGLYIKRQQDFAFFDWRRPFKGMPTFEREYRNLIWCRSLGIPVVEPIAFDSKDVEGHRQAVLITRPLTDYFSLDDMKMVDSLKLSVRRLIIRRVADVVRAMHENGVQHGCLYPKHIYVNLQTTDQPDVCLIDLEKASRSSLWNGGIMRDLDSLHRRAYGYTRSDRLVFLHQYCQGNHDEMRRLLRKLPAS